MLRLLRFFAVLLTLAVLAAAAGLYGFNHYFTSPGPLKAPITVTIPKGASAKSIAYILAKINVITYPLAFYGAVRFSGDASGLKAGEYAFTPGITPQGVMRKIRNGDVVVYSFTLPEGLTSMEAMALLFASESLTGAIEDIPAEGSLLPETYSFHNGESREALIKRMQAAMTDAMDDVWKTKSDTSAVKTKAEMLALASVIEKETGIAGERGLVGGVFTNRLNKGMRLQSDPTVMYAVTKGQSVMDRPLSKADLRKVDPYNTYTTAGIPPGPICNPGRKALEAAARPEKTDALYFVTDGTGGHVFTNRLRDHNRHVQKLRQRERERAQKAKAAQE